MENRKFTKNLPVPLTTEEKLNLADELVKQNQDHNRLEDEKAETVASFKAKQKTIETVMASIYRQLRSKTRDAEVEVEEYLEGKNVVIKRLDTLAIVSVRAATTKELNHELFEDEDSLALSFSRNDERLYSWLSELPTGTFRPFALEEIRQWTQEDFKAVESWVELYNYWMENPNSEIQLGDVPEVLNSEAPDLVNTAPPVEPETEQGVTASPEAETPATATDAPAVGESDDAPYTTVRCDGGQIVKVFTAEMPKREWFSAKYLDGKGKVRLYDQADRSIGTFDCYPLALSADAEEDVPEEVGETDE